jgi:pSer/pThr/pTyr-binding forkhead associated (FHA) protein
MWLTVHDPDGRERRVEVGAEAFSVGRGAECDLVLADGKASRRHALIERRPDGGFTLRDLASTNGTAVNGQTIAATVELCNGERITIGQTTLTVADSDAQPLPLSSAERPTRLRGAAAPTRVRPAADAAQLAAASPQGHEAESPRPPTGGHETRRRPRRTVLVGWAGGVVALLVIALVVAQLVLPRIATTRLRDSLNAHGTVQSVSVEAFPAVTLLWHHADKVTVRMRSYSDSSPTGSGVGSLGASGQGRTGLERLADFLASTSATDALDARVGELTVGRLALQSVVLTKQGAELSASAYASYGDIRAALPSYADVRPFAAGGGELIFTGAATLLGQHANVRLRLLTKNGALVIQPDLGPFLPSVLSLTVFKDPRVFVESVAAEPAIGGFNVSARARLSQG